MEALVATVQHYDWGDPAFIATLQSRPPSGRPEAELWMGAHPLAPSTLESTGQSLDALIAADPVVNLGAATAERFGELPYLAKVLAAARPLSIQAHPSVAQARAGFDREDAAGIPIDGRERVYRDRNHKPELICALTPFEAKCGFRPLDQTRDLLAAMDHGGLDGIRSRLDRQGRDADVLADVLAWLLRHDAEAGAELARSVVAAADEAPPDLAWQAELAWTAEIARLHPDDIGVVIALLLNHVVLEPGQALFLGAGNLHAYLRGAGIELMANSDNVVRGGLTSKHVDPDELLAIVSCVPTVPSIQTAVGCLHTYDAPVAEFSLTRLAVREDTRLRVRGPEILILTEGAVEVTTRAHQVLHLEIGTPVWVPASETCYVARGAGVLYRAAVGTR